MKRRILISFADGVVTWASVGWGSDEHSMSRAKYAIDQGENPAEVIKNLEAAGFVIVNSVPPGQGLRIE
jgi:hypothetical protein